MIWLDTTISHRAEVAELRSRLRHTLAPEALQENRRAQLELVLVELGTNLVKHAGGGRFIVRTAPMGAPPSIDVIALDRGPGMEHPERWLEDGASSTGTLGGGLGAACRLADDLEIYSAPGRGTAIFARFYTAAKPGPATPPARPAVDAVCVPKPGEQACGDAWAVRRQGGITDILVIDGLGHGPEAAAAAHRAVSLFNKHRDDAGPEETIRRLHGGLRGTRGGAAAVARIHPARARLDFAGVGNIAARIVYPGGRAQGIPSHYGIVGENLLNVRSCEFSWQRNALLIMHSDGLRDRWRLSDYPGLNGHAPAVIAAVLYRDFWRERDDVTVLVAK